MRRTSLKRARVSLGSFFFFLLAHAPICRAQSDGYVTNSNFRGVLPSASYQFGAIDNINLGTGTLNLNIPIAKRPGRGLDTHIQGIYNSKIWVLSCTKNVQGLLFCNWSLTTGPTAPVLSTAPKGTLSWDSEEYDCTDKFGNVYAQFNNTNFIYITADGSQYRFPNSCITHSPSFYSCASGRNVGTGVSDMGVMELDTSASGFILHFKDGHQETWTSDGTYLGITSTNGNQINSNGDTLKRAGAVAGTGQWTLLDSNGVAQAYSGTAQNATLQPQFPTTTCGSSSISQPATTGLGASTFTPPTGLQFKFTYDPNFGEVTRVDLPTGGYIRYDYVTLAQFDRAPPGVTCMTWIDSRRVAHRYVSPDGISTHEQTWTYAYLSPLSTGNGTYQTTVTDPLGFVTVHTFNSDGIHETQTQFYDQSNHLLRTVSNTWAADGIPVQTNQKGNAIIDNANWRITATTTTLADTNQVSQSTTTYDSYSLAYNYGTSTTYTTSRLNSLETGEYDCGTGAAGALLRRTDYTYLHDSNTSYLNTHILDRAASKIVYDSTTNTCRGQAQPCAQTTFSYDTTTITQTSGVVQHDYTNYPYTMTLRGNATLIKNWRNTDGAWLTTTKYYDDLGNLRQSQDPLLHNTFYDYTDSFSATGNVCIPAGGAAQAFATKITNHLGQSSRYSYYSCSSWIASATDLNNVTTSFTYDLVDRQLQTNDPDGGQITNCYTDVGGTTCTKSAAPVKVVTTSSINASQSKTVTAVLDGLGRVSQTQLNSDPQGVVYTDTTYDALVRVATVSNPYRSGTDPTSSPGTTTNAYDAFGRKTRVTYPDGSVLQTAYCGNSTLVTDPAGKWRRSRSDALGRLLEVDEPNAAGATVNANGCVGTGEPIWITSYSYDALGNLLQAIQNGSHQRNFTYDSLSHLLTAANPETGTITYSYDADGNVATKNDARNITITYGYDALHRLTSRTYSNADPSVTIRYDETNCLGLTSCSNIGQRTSMTDAAGSEAWSYQVDGANRRSVHVDQRTTTSSPSNITKTSTYYLDLAGNVTQAVYPTGRVVNYTYDTANRPKTAADGSNGITYATDFQTPPTGCLANAVCYTPQGSFYALSIGQTSTFNGLNLTHIYNNRLQPQEFKASSTGGNAIDITYSFVDPVSLGSAGHVYSITNNLNSARTQNFIYDQVNRITSAGTSVTTGQYCWGYQYTYDPWGNLLSQSGWTPTYNGCSEPTLAPITADGNNHISPFSYDAVGNATSDGTFSYSWDAESQLKSAAGVNYSYDGDGRRVYKSNGKLYWYGAGDEILAETDGSGNTTAEYIFFDGKRVAMLPAGGNPLYYVEDMLGSSRIVAQNNGVVCYDADFYPFGGERSYTNTCPQNYKFEGRERDTETGNDDFGARYYTSRFGRWLSADWSAVPVPVPYGNLTNPQTLNLYSMIADDPESFADLDGHDIAPFEAQSPVHFSFRCLHLMDCDPEGPPADKALQTAEREQNAPPQPDAWHWEPDPTDPKGQRRKLAPDKGDRICNANTEQCYVWDGKKWNLLPRDESNTPSAAGAVALPLVACQVAEPCGGIVDPIVIGAAAIVGTAYLGKKAYIYFSEQSKLKAVAKAYGIQNWRELGKAVEAYKKSVGMRPADNLSMEQLRDLAAEVAAGLWKGTGR